MRQNRHEIRQKLFEIAEAQEGLFTAKQAEQAGYLNTNHGYYVKTGEWIRQDRGIYRLALFPFSPHIQKVQYALWSSNRTGEIEGVYSYDTALSFYEITDLNPHKLHMTVPKRFRRSGVIPEILELDYRDLPPEDVQVAFGFKITTIPRTMRDLLESKEISPEFIEQGAVDVLRKGLMSRSAFMAIFAEAKMHPDVRRGVEYHLKKAA